MQKMQETYLKTIAEPSVDGVQHPCPSAKLQNVFIKSLPAVNLQQGEVYIY